LLSGLAAGSGGNLLSRPPWDLLGGGGGAHGGGGGAHGGAVELPAAALREPAAALAAKDAAGALRVIGRAGVVRTWLRLDASGDASTLHLDKHGIAQRCGVPLRDLRVLEPGLTTSCAPLIALLRFLSRLPDPRALFELTWRARAAPPPRSFSTALLCRERTMVINLEHVKARAHTRTHAPMRRIAKPHTNVHMYVPARACLLQMLVSAEEALIPNADLPEVHAFAMALGKRLKQVNGVQHIVHTRSVEARVPSHLRCCFCVPCAYRASC
jgi:hypothetical protein